ncbi:hypothetical protein EMIT0P260_70157 [Pseudomonas sp. IT-P260]
MFDTFGAFVKKRRLLSEIIGSDISSVGILKSKEIRISGCLILSNPRLDLKISPLDRDS